MQYHWIQDQQNQKQFMVQWKKGSKNLADYFTKHHAAKYHKEMQIKYSIDQFSNLAEKLHMLHKIVGKNIVN